ncbi:DUF5615 family PIN-like protein [Nostoc sp.]|uniref:DUF5615 family PIN-like protein n=1 Tax=Nostoc sp. TaxID=1180 RepID=UPI002FF7BD6A
MIATWITSTFGITALSLRDVGLRDAEDLEIFEVAKARGVIFITKDSDFVDLVDRLGSPPQIIWFTCGNTSNARSVARDIECYFARSIRAFANR